jgi:large subunit ribosomal protein L29
MKAAEIRKMSAEQINSNIAKLKEELFNLRFQLAVGQLENTARIKQVKKTIARMKTVLSEQAR